MADPFSIMCRWMAGQPPSSPYGTDSRAMVVGNAKRSAPQRAVPSAAILQMLYVRRHGHTPWLSASGPSSSHTPRPVDHAVPLRFVDRRGRAVQEGPGTTVMLHEVGQATAVGRQVSFPVVG